MRPILLLSGLLLMAAASAVLAPPAGADPRCAVVRASGNAVQAGGAFTPWEGSTTLRARGRVLEGWMTILSTDSNAPITPPFRLVGFSKVTYDFGTSGSFSTWAVSQFRPDETFYNWQFEGSEIVGSPLDNPFGWGTGAFATATGWLRTRGSMRFADPPPPGVPNTLDTVLTGRICDIDWDLLVSD